MVVTRAVRCLRYFVHRGPEHQLIETIRILQREGLDSDQIRDLMNYFKKEAELMRDAIVKYFSKREVFVKEGKRAFQTGKYDWSDEEILLKRKAIKYFFRYYGGLDAIIPKKDINLFFDTMLWNYTNLKSYMNVLDKNKPIVNMTERKYFLEQLGIATTKKYIYKEGVGDVHMDVGCLDPHVDWESI